MLAFAAVTAAQTKVSGTRQCGSKAEVEHVLPAPDSPDHAFSVSKWNCTWAKAMEIAGTPTKNGSSTGVTEVTGNSLQGHGRPGTLLLA